MYQDIIPQAYFEETNVFSVQDHTADSPFGIQQITDLLIVDLHVGHLHLESMGLVLLSVDPLKQGAAQPGDQTRLLPIPHHGKGLA